MAPPARRRRALRFHAAVAILYAAAAATAATETADELFAAALRAQSAGQIDEAVSLLGRSANLGDARAQTAYGLANHHGMGGLARDTAAAIGWSRRAARQGDEEGRYNLVALCDAAPSCLEGSAAEQEAWLRAGAAANHTEAAFQLGTLLLRRDARSAEALGALLAAARAGHASAAYNAAHALAGGGAVDGAGGGPADLTRALVLFGRAAAQTERPSVAADARIALARLRPLWVQQAEADDDVARTTARFEAAAEAADGAGVDEDEARCVRGWRAASAQFVHFQRVYHAHASYENAAAVAALRGAMGSLAALLGDDGCGGALGEMRRYLVLSKLSEGGKTLARDAAEAAGAARWHEALANEALCREMYAVVETQPSCFNDQLAAAVTLRRRAGDAAAADALVALANAHGRAATRWATQLQTPRVFDPSLAARPWWDGSGFAVVRELEAAWADGRIGADLKRLGIVAGGGGGGGTERFERIVSTGTPINGAPGADGDAAGVWSEFMLYDGHAWRDDRCAVASALCSVLRGAPETNGAILHANGSVKHAAQGQTTLFRLRPGARVLPHVGVTNRRLVVQFPLAGFDGVRFRVGDEWRGYEEGRALVFDDSFEHEVVHGGEADRFVLYTVVHHPELGTPQMVGEAEACGAGDLD